MLIIECVVLIYWCARFFFMKLALDTERKKSGNICETNLVLQVVWSCGPSRLVTCISDSAVELTSYPPTGIFFSLISDPLYLPRRQAATFSQLPTVGSTVPICANIQNKTLFKGLSHIVFHKTCILLSALNKS